MMSNKRGVNDDFALLVADLYEAAGAFRRSGELIAAAQGQTQSRWQTLSVVSAEPTTVAQAARRLGVSRQNVQRVANDLQREGLVIFSDNPAHKGSPIVTLLPSGRTVLKRLTHAASLAHRAQLRQLEKLDPNLDLAAVRSVLQRLTQAVRSTEEL
ncbi:DNA-binding MarR family transcriptional regulator [Jatrophihabitans sp. GAS493]|uniref:MarR family winged helix-turn-helix transcriptional regulator n=1 Tax=Jatrophihabitans sp. GAS493 TaxID=1907575 RepID=UPI000BB8EC21|nr:MarR family transcriptional regulator [Jatrophihabitans sp. GAS493]SOD72589.1 DNA-binding MarR family transcriptional regulator [Jatrophihabitans sp. GAS493]